LSVVLRSQLEAGLHIGLRLQASLNNFETELRIIGTLVFKNVPNTSSPADGAQDEDAPGWQGLGTEERDQ
jgi:hypothetical protein